MRNITQCETIKMQSPVRFWLSAESFPAAGGSLKAVFATNQENGTSAVLLAYCVGLAMTMILFVSFKTA